MGLIFISYRTDDTGGHSGRLYDRLVPEFGKQQLFRDAEAIPPGEHFPAVLDEKLRASDVLLALIGKRWLDARKGSRRRLADPADYVRREIATALERGIPVIPLLFDGVEMPGEKQLPADLAGFALLEAATIGNENERFHADVDRLVARIRILAA